MKMPEENVIQVRGEQNPEGTPGIRFDLFKTQFHSTLMIKYAII
jgi:hypothetical protein